MCEHSTNFNIRLVLKSSNQFRNLTGTETKTMRTGINFNMYDNIILSELTSRQQFLKDMLIINFRFKIVLQDKIHSFWIRIENDHRQGNACISQLNAFINNCHS